MAFEDLKVTDEDFAGKNIQSIGEDTVIGRAEELKRLFDAPAQEVLKEKFNALLEYLATENTGSELRTPEICEESGRTVAEQLAYLLAQMQNISAGGIADESIEDSKLSSDEGQIKARVEWIKNYLYDTFLTNAPHNSIVHTHATLTADDVETNALAYTTTNRGAFYALEYVGDPKFGTLPMNCGGTYNKDLAGAADGGIIVKRTASSSGEPYLGYTTCIAVDHGGTGATTAAAARTNLGAAAANHTHSNESVDITYNTTNFTSASGSVRYNPVTNTVFARIYVKSAKALTEGETYRIGKVTEHIPNYTHALAHAGAKAAVVTINTDGEIDLRPREAIAAGYDQFITGYWFG